MKQYNIGLLEINYLDYHTINIKIYQKDYEKIMNLKTIYQIDKIGYAGTINVLNKLIINKFIILFIILGLSIVFFLSQLVFTIEIVTNDTKMQEIIFSELNSNGLKKYHFKKNYQELQLIKKNILEKYKDRIDWIEIENIGTKYIVRYEPRLQNKKEDESNYRHIIAKKDAIIYNLDISNGQIIKNRNTYVKKGDIIVSGYISLNDSIKDTVVSKGKVYGEVWYTVSVTYPLNYKEIKYTGKEKNVYVLSLLNKNIELFNFHKYKDKRIDKEILLKNNLLPFIFEKQKQKEIYIINEHNTVEQAMNKALDVGTKKIESNLQEGEFILNKEIISRSYTDIDVTIKIFYSVIENITDYQEISEYHEHNETN